MNDTKYYDGTKLLSLKDINGNVPELYIITTNRTGGKTTYFSRMLINRFLKSGKKFALLCRWSYELDDVSDKFFKDIHSLFFSNYYMSHKIKAKGVYAELYLSTDGGHSAESDIKCCGYAIPLNKADAIKKYSHLFSDVECIMFDEFQPENNGYVADEIKKFLSIHTSISRGQGEQKRYVPVYMIGNQVSLINPYYVELSICTRLSENTNFLKGDGFVLEKGFIESASVAQKESGINRAFANNDYVTYASQNVYLNDNTAFIEKPVGISKYIATLKYNGRDYAIREYKELGIVYCDDSADKTYPFKISVTTDDHNINYVMLKNNDFFIQNMRYYFEKGCFRFKDLRCKECVLRTISY